MSHLKTEILDIVDQLELQIPGELPTILEQLTEIAHKVGILQDDKLYQLVSALTSGALANRKISTDAIHSDFDVIIHLAERLINAIDTHIAELEA